MAYDEPTYSDNDDEDDSSDDKVAPVPSDDDKEELSCKRGWESVLRADIRDAPHQLLYVRDNLSLLVHLQHPLLYASDPPVRNGSRPRPAKAQRKQKARRVMVRQDDVHSDSRLLRYELSGIYAGRYNGIKRVTQTI